MEMISSAEALDLLVQIAGPGKFAVRELRIKKRLNWRDKASSAIRHILQGERRLTPDEIRDIEIARIKFCADQIEANREVNRNLFSAMRSALAAMEVGDPEFYRPHIEAMRDAVLQLGHRPGEVRRSD
jgi:hypothetical protein